MAFFEKSVSSRHRRGSAILAAVCIGLGVLTGISLPEAFVLKVVLGIFGGLLGAAGFAQASKTFKIWPLSNGGDTHSNFIGAQDLRTIYKQLEKRFFKTIAHSAAEAATLPAKHAATGLLTRATATGRTYNSYHGSGDSLSSNASCRPRR